MPLELVQCLEGHTDRIWTLAWNPNGALLASSGSDKTIRMWRKENDNWCCFCILTDTHSKSIRRMCWSPCGQYLASASFDSTVCIWKNLHDSTWATVVNLEGHENEVKSIAWSSDGLYLASCGRDRTVWIWERAPVDPDQEEDVDNAANWDCSDVKSDHTKDVKHIVWHPKCNILASCSYDDTIKLFHKDGDDWKCYETLTSHTSTVWSADFSGTGEYLVTCSDDKTVRVWKNHAHHKLPNVEPNSWKCISVMQGYHSRSIYDISWCKHNDLIASASGDNALVLYNRSPEEPTNQDIFVCVDRLSGSHECDVNSVEWNPKVPELLASAGDDCKVKLWHYNGQDKGTKPLTVLDELTNSLGQKYGLNFDRTGQVDDAISQHELHVNDFSNLLNLIQSFQQLQNITSGNHDEEKLMAEKLLDLRVQESDQRPVELSSLCFGEGGENIEQFTIEIKDNRGEIVYRFKLVFDKYRLIIPRRSINVINIANELFLTDKTGDLYKILETGTCQFLLGHLFMFSGVGYILRRGEGTTKVLSYIISSDRDEKIRISHYPDTFNIERYCFGHKHLIKRVMVVDDKRFVSIDQQNTVCLWNLDQLENSDNRHLTPISSLKLDESVAKRVCLRENSGCKIVNTARGQPLNQPVI